MTDEQKYTTLLKELAALLADKNATISIQQWEIADLTAKLSKPESELESLTITPGRECDE